MRRARNRFGGGLPNDGQARWLGVGRVAALLVGIHRALRSFDRASLVDERLRYKVA